MKPRIRSAIRGSNGIMSLRAATFGAAFPEATCGDNFSVQAARRSVECCLAGWKSYPFPIRIVRTRSATTISSPAFKHAAKIPSPGHDGRNFVMSAATIEGSPAFNR